MAQDKTPPIQKNSNGEIVKKRLSIFLLITFVGFSIFFLGLRPDVFQMDRSPVMGFIQIAVMVTGLGILCLGGYLSMRSLWNGTSLSIAAAIGIRFISTGLVISVFSALADFFGFGSHPYPESLPYLGEWQVLGVIIGEYIIALGFLLMFPYQKIRIFPNLSRSDNSKSS